MGHRARRQRLGRLRAPAHLRGRGPAGDGAHAALIDLHCHILPALDDGAIDLEDSVAMAAVAEADGIEIVCATPHIHPAHEVPPAEIEGRARAVNDALARRGIATRVAPGGELAEVEAWRLDDETLRRISLGGGGRWLLLEPRPGPLGDSLVTTVAVLAERGFCAVIAHPERHAAGDFFERVAELVEHGALVQATAALVAQGPASGTLLELARRGLLHLLGSDAHSSHGGRPVRLSEGFAQLATVDPIKPHLDWMMKEAPAAILRGERVSAPFAPI